MAGLAARQLLIFCGLGLALAGCEDGMTKSPPDAAQASASGTVRLVERDVEAPAVFQVTEPALWDGRPSLGGVWLAHPDVKDPERVIIRNPENGKFVIGALFRRERENPGPKLQVSSDAASALGLLAGKPTSLNVTALRREEEPAAPAAAAEVKVATADSKTRGTPAAAAGSDTATEDAAPQEKERRGLFGFLRPKPKVETAAAGEVTETTLAPLDSAAAALDRADAGAAPRPAAAPTATAAAAPAPAPQRPRATLDKPYIQIGIFSVEENATNTAAAFGRAGVLPVIKAQQSQGKKFWRVLVGPSPTASDRDALLKKVKGLGFTDAYFVTN